MTLASTYTGGSNSLLEAIVKNTDLLTDPKLNSLTSAIRIKSDKIIYSEVRMEQVTVQILIFLLITTRNSLIKFQPMSVRVFKS